MHHALYELAKRYKTRILGLTLGREYYIVVFKREYVKEVLVRPEFQARPDNFFIRLRSLGSRKGITMTDGYHWQVQRQFLVRHLRNLGFGKTGMEALIHNALKDLIDKLGDGGPEINISQHLPKCVLNVLWKIAGGSTFSDDDEQLDKFLYQMGRRSKAFDIAGGLLTQFPWLRYIAPEISGYNLINNVNKHLSALIKKTIEEHKLTYDKNKTRDYIDVFLHQMSMENHDTTFTEEQLTIVCFDLFIAGSQTTSNTLDFALLQMILHPEIQREVQKDIDKNLVAGELPKMSDRSRMHYVEAVLAEVFRLYSVAPTIGPRRVLKDTSIGGFFIPKGTTVLIHIDSVHKDPDEWDDSLQFKPERFLDENRNFLSTEQLFTFGYGIRRCPGEVLAKNFLFIFFTGLLQHFHMSIVENAERPSDVPIPGISISPRPYLLQLKRRHPQSIVNNNQDLIME
ncbi:hypothetical protein AAG570_012234 [Ranatra chinensis]|uniref:Cytochrome P450 n=1 Tax=Ranatra chinensis TaxID=642074 RepID=A0ABD0Z0G7_9HEMI